jgi:hypothetical protein
MFAAACAAALLLLAPMFGPLVGFVMVPTGAVIALVTLRFGPREGLKVAAIATSFAVVVRIGLAQGAIATLVMAASLWLPAWLMACVLRAQRAQRGPLLTAAAILLVYAGVFRVMVKDVASFWREALKPVFEMLAKDGATSLTPKQIDFFVSQMHEGTLVGMLCIFGAVIMLARWWQAELYNVGGFGAEFRELRLPRSVTMIAAAFALVYSFGPQGALLRELAGDACALLVVLFALQGLAVIHFMARVRGLAAAWLITLYAMLVLAPLVAGPILATTGLADNIVDFRRLHESRQP